MLIFCLKNLCKWQDRFDDNETDSIQKIELVYKKDKK